MERLLPEATLPDEAVKALTSQGLGARWSFADDGPIDGRLTIVWADGEQTFPVITKAVLPLGAVEMLPEVPNGVVLTNEVKPAVRKALQSAGWGYLDTTGAALLTAPGVFVRVDGWRRAAQVPSIERPFSKTGLPVTFVVLVRGGLAGVGSQRGLAALAGASLGTTNRVLKGLRQLGHLSEDGSLLKRSTMADRWIESYLALSELGGFAAQRYASGSWERPTEALDRLPAGAHAGSELAAWARGQSIRPQSALIYCAGEARNKVILSGRLKPDAGGWVQLRTPFWGEGLLSMEESVVPDLLIRADLLAAADPRLAAAAKVLR